MRAALTLASVRHAPLGNSHRSSYTPSFVSWPCGWSRHSGQRGQAGVDRLLRRVQWPGDSVEIRAAGRAQPAAVRAAERRDRLGKGDRLAHRLAQVQLVMLVEAQARPGSSSGSERHAGVDVDRRQRLLLDLDDDRRARSALQAAAAAAPRSLSTGAPGRGCCDACATSRTSTDDRRRPAAGPWRASSCTSVDRRSAARCPAPRAAGRRRYS